MSSVDWPVIGELAQPPAQQLALAGVHAGGRLVEAQQPGRADDGAREPHQFALALGELAGYRLGDRGQAPSAEHRFHAARPRRRASTGGDGEVLADVEVVEKVGALPCAGAAQPGDGVRCQPGDVVPGQPDAARVADEAGDGVDERRLAGAVGADQAHQLARGHLEVDFVERVDAAEGHRQPRTLRTGASPAPPARPARRGPRGRRRRAAWAGEGRRADRG